MDVVVVALIKVRGADGDDDDDGDDGLVFD